MATKDPRVDAYIAKLADFAKPILKHFRKPTRRRRWEASAASSRSQICQARRH